MVPIAMSSGNARPRSARDVLAQSIPEEMIRVELLFTDVCQKKMLLTTVWRYCSLTVAVIGPDLQPLGSSLNHCRRRSAEIAPPLLV